MSDKAPAGLARRDSSERSWSTNPITPTQCIMPTFYTVRAVIGTMLVRPMILTAGCKSIIQVKPGQRKVAVRG